MNLHGYGMTRDLAQPMSKQGHFYILTLSVSITNKIWPFQTYFWLINQHIPYHPLVEIKQIKKLSMLIL